MVNFYLATPYPAFPFGFIIRFAVTERHISTGETPFLSLTEIGVDTPVHKKFTVNVCHELEALLYRELYLALVRNSIKGAIMAHCRGPPQYVWV